MTSEVFDPIKPLRCACYGRNSADCATERTAARQLDELEFAIAGRGYPWTIVCRYLDNGVSGGSTRSLPGFRQMIDDIRSGRVEVDAVLVRDVSRFGRTAAAEMRRQLAEEHGVLVLTADSGFADPNSLAGSMPQFIQGIAATE